MPIYSQYLQGVFQERPDGVPSLTKEEQATLTDGSESDESEDLDMNPIQNEEYYPPGQKHVARPRRRRLPRLRKRGHLPSA